MNTGDVIKKALEVWDERGWCREQVVDAAGSVCALGALEVALNNRVDANRINENVRSIARVVAKYLPEDYVGPYAAYLISDRSRAAARITGYNDQYGYEAIRKVFEKAALDQGVTL